jgi:hypothetical protein
LRIPWHICLALEVLCLSGSFGAEPQTPAERLVDQAHRALSPSGVNGVASLALRGTIRNATAKGDLSSPLPIEIYIAFPGRYLQLTHVPGALSALGVDRNALLYKLESSFSGPPSRPTVPDDMLLDVQDRMAKFVLLALLRTDTIVPLTVQRGVADSASATTLEFRGRRDMRLSVDVDKTTHWPIRVRYSVKQRDGMAGSRTGPVVELTEEVAERKPIDGIQLPIRLVIRRDGKLQSEYAFDTVRVNAADALPDFSAYAYRR